MGSEIGHRIGYDWERIFESPPPPPPPPHRILMLHPVQYSDPWSLRFHDSWYENHIFTDWTFVFLFDFYIFEALACCNRFRLWPSTEWNQEEIVRHFFFLPSKIKVLNFIKRERLKQIFLSHSKSSRVLLIFVVPLNLKTLKLLRFPSQKHSQLPSTLVCLLNLHNQWKKMASRWPLLIQTSLSGEIRSWRCLPSPWLVSRATRRITILYLDTKHTSKFFLLPDAWSFHAITKTRFFIYWSAYLLFNSIIIQLGLQNLSAILRFSSETIRDMISNWNTIPVDCSLINIGEHSSTARWTEKYFTEQNEHCEYSLSKNPAIHH